MGAFHSRGIRVRTPEVVVPAKSTLEGSVTRRWICCGLLPWSVAENWKIVQTKHFTPEDQVGASISKKYPDA